jgi:hypothetical protein
MKKLLLFVLLFISVVTNAQKGISYQAVILDPSKIEIPGQDISGQPLVNGNVSVKFVILSGTTSQFEEVQQTKTDAYGLVNLTIGSVASTAFNSVTWDANQKSLQVFVSFNNGASYTKVSDQKLTYTPYSLFAETAGKLGSTLGIAGGGTGATTAAGARVNLGLGNVDNTADAAKPVSTATQAALNLKANAADVNAALDLKASAAMLAAHMAITVDTNMLATKAALTDLNNFAPKASPTFTGMVSGIDKSMVGLGSVDNTSDAAKPISTATQAALDLKANTSNTATALSLKANTADMNLAFGLKAPLISPALTGVPTAPTAAPGTNTSQIATTAFTTAAIATATAGASSGVADNSVTSVKIADGSISTVDIANGAVSDAKIQTVSGSKITGVIPVLSGGTGLSSFGINGQVLTSTGGGTMTWTTASSGGGSGVPYTGATGAVNLGAYDLTVNNITIGRGAGFASGNTAIGDGSLRSNTGADNTALGFYSLYANTTGYENTANGNFALFNNTTGLRNTATGTGSLRQNIGGERNAAFGLSALYSNTTGSYNTAVGAGAGYASTTGTNNTFIGFDAAGSSVTASNEVILGNAFVTKVITSGTVTAGTVTYPNAHGTSGQVLSTTGSGTLAWTSVSGGGSGVPYTGATGAVDLGAYDLKVNGLTIGTGAGTSTTTSLYNTAVGFNTLITNTTGSYNSAFGRGALRYNTAGSWNTSLGIQSLNVNTTGNNNTAVGATALFNNTTGSDNAAMGLNSLFYNTTGNYNTAVGTKSLFANTIGSENTALGQLASYYNQTGSYNTTIGTRSMFNNLYGNSNTAVGWNAGTFTGQGGTSSISGGNNNTSMGFRALYANTLGNDNTAVGYNALQTNLTGAQNTTLGSGADVATNALSNATAIGYGAIANTSNTIQLGNSSVTNIKTSGTITAGVVTYPNTNGSAGQVLTANSNGQASWTTASGGSSGPQILTTSQRDALNLTTSGVMIFNSTLNKYQGSIYYTTGYNYNYFTNTQYGFSEVRPGYNISQTFTGKGQVITSANIAVVSTGRVNNTGTFTFAIYDDTYNYPVFSTTITLSGAGTVAVTIPNNFMNMPTTLPNGPCSIRISSDASTGGSADFLLNGGASVGSLSNTYWSSIGGTNAGYTTPDTGHQLAIDLFPQNGLTWVSFN